MNRGEDPLLEHYSAVCGFLTEFTGRADLAEDLTQDTFALAYRWMDRYDREPDRPKPWLRAIARNLATSYFRREQGRAHVARVHESHRAGERDTDSSEQLEGLIEAEEQASAAGTVHQALNTLSEVDRSLIKGYHIHGHSCGYLGRALGVDRQVIKVRLFRARKKMRRALEEQMEETNG